MPCYLDGYSDSILVKKLNCLNNIGGKARVQHHGRKIQEVWVEIEWEGICEDNVGTGFWGEGDSLVDGGKRQKHFS
jgi:hypothetical protein